MAQELTDQQQRFVDAYLADPNLSVEEAALIAGYSKSFSASGAYQLVRNPKVAAAIDAEMAKRAARTRVTKDRVIREIASIAFSNIDDYEIDEDGRIGLRDGADVRAMKAVSSMKRTVTYDKDGFPKIVTEIKLWDKGQAQDKLARHLNLFKEDQEAGAIKVTPKTSERDAALHEMFGGVVNGEEDEDL
jgi:phage terminase small subunit